MICVCLCREGGGAPTTHFTKTVTSHSVQRIHHTLSSLCVLQIEEYMDQLPNHKVPRVGTPGERYRDLQLIRQLPKQDLSDRYCKALEDPSETKEFRIFRELRDQVAMDIGAVKEAPTDTVRGMGVAAGVGVDEGPDICGCWDGWMRVWVWMGEDFDVWWVKVFCGLGCGRALV